MVTLAMQKYVYERMHFRVHYAPLDPQGFLIGTAMLVLRDFCDYTVV
jgi:hypothetical protein